MNTVQCVAAHPHSGWALEDGRLNKVDLHLLSADAIDLLFALLSPAGGTDLRCVITRWDIENGVATSQVLLIVTPRMSISGSGVVNLKEEELEIEMAADQKGFVPSLFRQPVVVHGSLASPEIDSGTHGHTAPWLGKLGGLIFAPFIFVPAKGADYLATFLMDDGSSPCFD